MPGSDIPVLRQPFGAGDALPFWVNKAAAGKHHLYDLDVDPDEQENRLGGTDERSLRELLGHALRSIEAPDDLLVRLDC